MSDMSTEEMKWFPYWFSKSINLEKQHIACKELTWAYIPNELAEFANVLSWVGGGSKCIATGWLEAKAEVWIWGPRHISKLHAVVQASHVPREAELQATQMQIQFQ